MTSIKSQPHINVILRHAQDDNGVNAVGFERILDVDLRGGSGRARDTLRATSG